MKVLTIFGTRPEIIRLSLIMQMLDRHCDHVIVHTGQNYDPNLSEVFMKDLGIRQPDYHLGVDSSSFGAQAGQIIAGVDEILERTQVDRVLILGDTNSGLAAIPAARRRIPIYHLEAGNRCYDKRVPEELNRRIIDHSSDILMPYTHRSAANLVAEGIRRENIFVVGNPILEVLEKNEAKIQASNVLKELGLSKGNYFLATLHRAENVDLPDRLRSLISALTRLAEEYDLPVVVSVHPRTADRIQKAKIEVDPKRLRLEKPFGLFDFIFLEQGARGVVTDSGTVQEEACIYRIPNVTIRDVTERPETVECGSNFLSGPLSDSLIRGMKLAIATGSQWQPPDEYSRQNVSATVVKILLSYRMRSDSFAML